MICIYMIYSLLSPHCYDMYYIYFDEVVEEVRKTLTFLLLLVHRKSYVLGSVYILHYTFGSSDLEIKSVLLKYITETYYYNFTIHEYTRI